ncbi:hypothetical protein BAUCODRAFT_31356 [Baudoinia panamericana UAMH 10762]|uniref:Methyltransferase domain-containing protein n=1 Tax=Baudoinia panamericana (strain UAMH 10762) TaxID=717646 RepID=M2LWN5_BAUPA|nr:uncharacterized protein BAUCODRAFT_31356 [Baudoinia panamericana UAMH 10762]EMC99072.1 hypothetical protein BAUCODRAFT_31356 [Baudoinia panamericana UAMH 10762]
MATNADYKPGVPYKEENERLYDGLLEVFAERKAATYAAHLLPLIKPDHFILDLGSGPGSITMDLARLVPDGSVVAADISSDWLGQSRELAKRQGVTNVTFEVADATNLHQFADDTFDIVHAHQLLYHVPEQVRAIREMRRVLKPNGIFSTRDLHTWLVSPSPPQLKGWRILFPQVVEKTGRSESFGSESHIVAHEAGFHKDKIEVSSWAWEMSTAKSRSAWVSGWKRLLTERAIEYGMATEEEMHGYEKAWEEWAGKGESRFIAVDGATLAWK